jgi:hypothetical protein
MPSGPTRGARRRLLFLPFFLVVVILGSALAYGASCPPVDRSGVAIGPLERPSVHYRLIWEGLTSGTSDVKLGIESLWRYGPSLGRAIVVSVPLLIVLQIVLLFVGRRARPTDPA